MISKNTFFIFFVLNFLFAVFVYNIINEIYSSFIILLVIVVFFLCVYFFSKKYFVVLIAIIFGYCTGILIASYSGTQISMKEISIEKYLDGSKYQLQVEVEGIHKINEYSKEYRVNVLQIEDTVFDEDIEAIIKIPYNFELEKGYIIQSKTKLYPFKNMDSFYYKEYMFSKNIFFSTYMNAYEIIEKRKITSGEQILITIRQKFLSIIYDIYPEEEAVFLGGILIGAREFIPQQLKTDFNNSGLTHFIAVSGFNMTILILFIGYMLQYFPIFIRVIGITTFIVIFTLIVGDTAPVIRAAIMGLVGYYVMISGRQGNSLSIILLTAFLMILYSPLSLNYDVSFHLSFLAVLGIIYTQDFFKKIFYFLPTTLNIKEAFVLTLGALSFTLPIMVFNFGQISLLSPIANIAVTWTIPLAMLLGFLSVIGYIIFPALGILIGYFTWVFLKWDIGVVHFFGRQEFALFRLDLGSLSRYFELLYFIILVFLILWFRGGKQEHRVNKKLSKIKL